MASSTNSEKQLSFRLATAADASDLAALINAAFRSERTGQTWLYDSQDKRVDIVSVDLISSFISDPKMVMLVGTTPEDDSKPVTTVYLRQPSQPPASHISPNASWLGFLAVSPASHKRGYGLAMLKEAERFVLEEWHVKRLEFDFVSSRSELRAWYERCGYVATGAKRDFPYGEKGREILAGGLEMIVLGRDLE